MSPSTRFLSHSAVKECSREPSEVPMGVGSNMNKSLPIFGKTKSECINAESTKSLVRRVLPTCLNWSSGGGVGSFDDAAELR
jgi:hypothetical protein